MRVTNKMTSELITRELYSNQQMLLNAQVKVTTGKKINKPSDDPIGAHKVLDYRRILSSIEQYERNIVYGKNQIEITETILDQMDTSAGRIQTAALSKGAAPFSGMKCLVFT